MKRKKFSDKEIEDLKKTISETKEVYEDTFGEKKVETDPIVAYERMATNAIERSISESFDRSIWDTLTGILSSPQSDPTYFTTNVGGQVSDGSNTLFRILTAQIRHRPLPMGSGISLAYSIEATIDISSPFDISRDTVYEFYFNDGGRQYRGQVTVEMIERKDNGEMQAIMNVIGALNIT